MARAVKSIFIFIFPTSFLIILPTEKLYNQIPGIVKGKNKLGFEYLPIKKRCEKPEFIAEHTAFSKEL
jgi:hypothetical protein